jgi:hypothetical protein
MRQRAAHDRVEEIPNFPATIDEIVEETAEATTFMNPSAQIFDATTLSAVPPWLGCLELGTVRFAELPETGDWRIGVMLHAAKS